MTPNPDAVKAAAEALVGVCHHGDNCSGVEWHRDQAAAAVAAAEPIIRAAIAAEQAAWECDDEWTCCIEAHRARSGRES